VRDPRATKRLDPLLIPKTYGPARGLLNSVCIRSPQTDKADPAIKAVNALGILNSLITNSPVLVES
jgi:hypothetical protein